MAGSTTGGVPKEVLIERERRAWELRRKGYTHERIAEELGLDRTTITKMLIRLAKRANGKLDDQIAEVKQAQASQLEYVIDEALQAWIESKKAQKSVSKRTATRTTRFGVKAPPEEETMIQTADQDGNPRYLEAARSAMADLRKLLGLEGPQRHEVTGKGGGPVQVDVTKLTDDELLALVTGAGER